MAPRSTRSPNRTPLRRIAPAFAALLLAVACERETMLGSNWMPLEPGPDAGPSEDVGGTCGSSGFLYVDRRCGLNPQGAYTCTDVGDGLCHRTCSSNADCPEPGEPYCRRFGLYAFTGDACRKVVTICSAVQEDRCP